MVLCSALFAFLALLTLTNTCFPIQVEYWISIRFTFFDAFQYVVRLLGTSLCTYFTDVFTHECSILVVFFSSTCHSQQSIANIGFMREATIWKVRDKKFCSSCCLRHGWKRWRARICCLNGNALTPYKDSPLLPTPRWKTANNNTRFTLYQGQSNVPLKLTSWLSFFLEGKSFFKLPMLHFHFPLIKANLCIFWVPFTNFFSRAFMHTGKLLGSKSGPKNSSLYFFLFP